MNNTYCFILGNSPSLNTLDVLKVLKAENIEFEIIESSDEVLLIKTKERLNTELLIDQTGSCQKIAAVFSVLPSDNFENNLLKEIKTDEFEKFFLAETDKIDFGISVYNARGEMYASLIHKVSEYCRLIKNQFSSSKKIGFLFIKDSKLSSVSVKKNKLLTSGFEMVLIAGKENVYLAKTVAVQDFEGYSFRDYNRPARDSRSGMIPPKLAKMMINLAGKTKDAIILDPFCGSGTILQEAILLGYKNIYGSDIEDKAVEDTDKNLKWLFENYHNLLKDEIKIDIQKIDAARLSEKYSSGSIDAIITEPFLGSPNARFFSKEKVEKEIKFLEELYFQAFKEFKKVLKENGVVVIIFPVFNLPDKSYYLDLKRILKLGFITEDFNQDENIKKLNLDFTARNSLIFSRSGQVIEREVFIFKIKNPVAEKPQQG